MRPGDQDQTCRECLEPYYRACREAHTCDVYCIDIDDVRQFACGCYGHKNCVKSGPLHNCRTVLSDQSD